MWRRMPTWFPNIRLQMMALSQEQRTSLLETGWLREVAFKTEPRVNKVEIKAFLEAVYGMQVERVNTINYQGKKKRDITWKGNAHWYRRSDWKKAYVVFKPPPEIAEQWQRQHAQDQQQRLQELQDAVAERRAPNLLPAAAAEVAAVAAPAAKAAADAAQQGRKERRRERRAAAAAAAEAAGAAAQRPAAVNEDSSS